MLCYVLLLYVMLWCGVACCYAMPCIVMLCYVMLCYVMLCYVMLCYVILCYLMLSYVMLDYAICCVVFSVAILAQAICEGHSQCLEVHASLTVVDVAVLNRVDFSNLSWLNRHCHPTVHLSPVVFDASISAPLSIRLSAFVAIAFRNRLCSRCPVMEAGERAQTRRSLAKARRMMNALRTALLILVAFSAKRKAAAKVGRKKKTAKIVSVAEAIVRGKAC